MDAVGRLMADAWKDSVRSEVMASGLSFLPWDDRPYLRDMRALRHMAGDDGLDRAIAFCQGRYDNWAAVVLQWSPEGNVSMAYPKDEYYFSRLAAVALCHGDDRVFADIRTVYAMADNSVREECVREIGRLADAYGEDAGLMYNMMMHVYYGLVAEEHYQRVRPDGTVQRTAVGKMMKMHALYRLLVEHASVTDCASECVGMSPEVIAMQADNMGIVRTVPDGAYTSCYDDPSTMPVTRYGDRKGTR